MAKPREPPGQPSRAGAPGPFRVDWSAGLVNVVVLGLLGVGLVVSLGHLGLGLLTLDTGGEEVHALGLRFAGSGATAAASLGCSQLAMLE